MKSNITKMHGQQHIKILKVCIDNIGWNQLMMTDHLLVSHLLFWLC